MAQRVGSSIEELAEAIVQIKRSADETANIVKAIDDIAFQRNILAGQSPVRRDQLAMESNQPILSIYEIREVLGLVRGKAVAPPQLEFLGNPRQGQTNAKPDSIVRYEPSDGLDLESTTPSIDFGSRMRALTSRP